jgi:hypothetical protein
LGATGGIVVGAVMFASQVGPDEAISNLSLWVQKAGVHAPAWLKAAQQTNGFSESALSCFSDAR